ncbi:T9SS C-terminal target domain-containing protein [candidate division KSB1 bacterium]|nr:MAG: T9SS C-terminal target domain-containing protein [candidate division KSB1 bacterium]
MKMKLATILLVMLFAAVGTSHASIGWAGMVYPCDGMTYLDNADIDVYVQIWKDGCTSGGGACAGLSAWLYYKKASEGTYTMLAMNYLGENGNNDEYKGTIPAAATSAGDNEMFYVDCYDSSDATWYYGAKNQWSCTGGEKDPPFSLNISPAIDRDVTVTFRVDMICLDPSWYWGGVFVAGGLNGWSGCALQMFDPPDGDYIFEYSHTFAAGSNPYQEYKFNKNAGSCDWEGGGNRAFTIDDDNSTHVLPVEVWDRWDCCTPSGPASITIPGRYCVTLCACNEYLDIPLVTPYNPPVITNISFTPGCDDCGGSCAAGAGDPSWQVVNISGTWVLRLSLLRIPGDANGCFCMTIDNILPVELGSFEAVADHHGITLNWTTRSERNNDHFNILRDGAFVHETASLGNTEVGHDYSWTDENAVSGVSYTYTLVAVDVNGTSRELATASASFNAGTSMPNEYMLGENYPNPFNPSTTFAYSLKEAGLVTINVYDVSGRVVANLVNENLPAGQYNFSYNAADLPSGVYYYQMKVNGFTATQKMVLMK